MTPGRLHWVLLSLTAFLTGSIVMGFEMSSAFYLRLLAGGDFTGQVVTIVLTLGGLAWGTWAGAKHSLLKARPLQQVAIACLLLSLSLLVLPALHASVVHYNLAPGWFSGLVVSAVGILPPAFLAGYSYPLIVEAFAENHTGRAAGWFYGLTTVGAMAGAWLVTFRLAGRIHFDAVMAGMSALALLAGLLALSGRKIKTAHTVREYSYRQSHGVWAFVAGFSALMFQTSILRLLTLVTGSSYRSFGWMLALLALGMAGGSLYAIRNVLRKEDKSPKAVQWMFLTGAGIMVSYVLFPFSFGWMETGMQAFSRTETGWLGWNLWTGMIAAILIVPPSFFSGGLFAILASGDGSTAGKVYTLNTLGAIAGAIVSAGLLFPYMGAVYALAAGGLLLMGISLMAQSSRKIQGMKAAGLAAGCIATILLSPHPSNLVSGVFRTGHRQGEGEVIFRKDGRNTSVAVTLNTKGHMSLLLNGKPDAGISMTEMPATDEPVEILLGALPLSLHPGIQTAAVIGMGSGLTSHVLLGSDALQSLDLIEIEPAVAEASRNFGMRVRKSYHDPRCQIHIADARGWFSKRPEQYDLIVSEPSNPWVRGCGSLFSEGFYSTLSKSLKPEGLFVQWIQLYESQPALVAAILRSLSVVFADYDLYLADDGNLLAVASRQMIQHKPGQNVFGYRDVREDLARIGIYSAVDIGIRYLGNRSWMQDWVIRTSSAVPVYNDLLPWLEREAFKALFMQSDALQLNDLREQITPWMETWRPGLQSGLSPYGFRSRIASLTRKANACYEVISGKERDSLWAQTPLLREQIGHLEELMAHPERIEEAKYTKAFANTVMYIFLFASRAELDEMWTKMDKTLYALLSSDKAQTIYNLYKYSTLRDTAQLGSRVHKILIQTDTYPAHVVYMAHLQSVIHTFPVRGRENETRFWHDLWEAGGSTAGND